MSAKERVRERSSCIAASAASSTSASRQPPPTVPRKLPSRRTSIFIVVLPGVEPTVLVIVHSAHGSPSF